MIETTPEGVARSFWAAALCLPAYLALRLLAWSGVGGPVLGWQRGLIVEMLGFAVAWAGYAVASRPVAAAAGRGAEWPAFIAAWNWTNVVQFLVMLGAAAAGELGLPALLVHGLELAGLGYQLWLEWFVARTALRVGGWRASLFVLLDLVIGTCVNGVVARLADG